MCNAKLSILHKRFLRCITYSVHLSNMNLLTVSGMPDVLKFFGRSAMRFLKIHLLSVVGARTAFFLALLRTLKNTELVFYSKPLWHHIFHSTWVAFMAESHASKIQVLTQTLL